MSIDSEMNENVAGAQGSVVFSGITYLIDQVTDKHIATLHKHLRRHLKSPLASIVDSLAGLPLELQKTAIQEAVQLQANGGAEGNEAFFRDGMQSAEGCGFLFWLLAKKNHPDLSLERCVAIINENNPEVALGEIAEASGFMRLAEKGN
jgi:hypothetical protein